MEYGGGMNELPYPSDLTAAQWALIEPLLPAPKPKGRKRRVDLRKITNAILMCSKAASVGACCRVNLLPGRPCTIAFVFGGSPGSGTGFMINSGIRYGLAKADIRAAAVDSNRAIFSDDDPDASEKLIDKLERLMKRQGLMKRANQLIRKADREGLADLGFADEWVTPPLWSICLVHRIQDLRR